MEEDIIVQTGKEINEFQTKAVNLLDGFSYNQYNTVRRILLYWNSKFETGEYDSEGFRKFFYNVNKFRCQVATKAIDLDTKDIEVIAEEGQSYYPVWFFEKELRQWMKEKEFGKLLNRIVTELPIFGTVVVKKFQDRLELVDLKNFIVEQSADSLENAGYIIERHLYTPEELKRMPWDKDAIEELVNNYYKAGGKKYIEVFERYGAVPETWLDGEDLDNFVNARFIVGILEPIEKEEKRHSPGKGVILDKEEIDELPYKELHWTKTPGRWLGIGIVEELFEPQMRVNEIINLKAKGLWWTSLKIFQTRDEMVNRNLLQDVVNGEVLKVQSEITPIANEERNLSAYGDELNRWEALMDKQVFTYDTIRGERLPSGIPLGSTILQTQMAGGFFEFQRENVGLFLKDIIMNFLIPIFKQEKSEEHIVSLIGEEPEEISKWEALRLNWEYNQKILNYIRDKHDIPTQREANAFKAVIAEKLKQPKERFVRIPEKYYENLKYKVNIVITGESIDVAAKLSTLQVALQLIASNPMILKDEQSKKVFYKLLDLSGINPVEFEVATELPSLEETITREIPLEEMPRGGSIARPVAPTATPPILPNNETI